MTIEEKLRDCILMNYRSMREFTLKADIPYSTLDTILKRGVMNASIGNILKICSALNISADELANGNIVPVENKSEKIDVEKILIDYKLNDRIVLELDGLELSEDELLLLSDSMEVSIGIIKRRRESSKRMSAYVEGLSKAFKNIQSKKEGEEE